MLSRRTLPMVLYLGNVSRDDAIAATPKLKSGEDVVGNVNTHNHAAEPCRKETLQIKNAIKRRAIDTDETAQQVISTAVTNCSEAAAAQLPPLRHIRRGI
jgi:polysaccharide pyruvyl transferase WcaK-like protein